MSGHFTKTNMKIGLVQGFYFMALCVLFSFLVRLLKSYGYNDFECGIALSCGAFATLTVQPLAGMLADRVKSVGRLIVLLLLASCMAIAALLLVHQNRVLTYVFIFILFGTMRPLTYIIDVWSIRTGASDPSFSYGFTRSFGSLAYAVASLLFGLAIDAFGTGFIIPCFLVLCIVTMYVVVLASSTPKDFSIEKPRNKIGILRSLYVLFSNKYYVLLVVCFTLMEISRMPGQNYLTRKFEVMGAKEMFTGLAFFVTAIIQLPALNKMDSLKKRHRATSLMWVSLTGVSLRITLLGITTTTLGTLCSLLIDLVGLGLYVGSLIYYMLHFLPPEVHFLGMTVYAAFTGGLGGMIGNYIAGILANKYGVLAMYKLTAIPAAVGLLIYSICMFAWRKGNPKS